MGDEVQRQAGRALLADEVALEERATGDKAVVSDAAEQGDAALDGNQAGSGAAGEDLGGQVDQLGVLAPGPDGDGDVSAGTQDVGQRGEDLLEPGEQAVVADVGEVPAVEQVAVEVVVLLYAAARDDRDLAVTDLDVSTSDRAVAVEHWYRHRTQIENLFRDSKLGAALRHLPSGHPEVNRAWMSGGLLAATLVGWLHHRLIAVPARLIRYAGALTLRLPPGEDLLAHVLARIRTLPAPS